MSWMLVVLVPFMGMVFDVAGKVFSNMFFPTQTQIHVEIFVTEKGNKDSDTVDPDDLKLSVEESK